MDLEFGHRSLEEALLTALLQLLPQGDDVGNAGPEVLGRYRSLTSVSIQTTQAPFIKK